MALSGDYIPKTEQEMMVALRDPWWRLCNLYKILVKDEDDDTDPGLVMTFRPNWAQIELYENMSWRNIILKARQLGFTTGIVIYFLDCVLFRRNVRAGIVAHNDEAVEKIFSDKILFAYDHLPADLRAAMPTVKRTSRTIEFGHNGSRIDVGMSMRSGTLQYLLVSEFGKICANDKKRAREVLTGSLPAAEKGLVFIESTAEGREGAFFDMTERARAIQESGRTPTRKEFKLFFYPWFESPDYTMDPAGVIITEKQHDYFNTVEGEMDVVLSRGQRAWYVSTLENEYAGDTEMMWQEYPSTPTEPFQVSLKGTFYERQISAVRRSGRLTTLPYHPGVPVNTFWDIGHGDGTAIWFHQQIGEQHHFINFIEGWGEPYAYFVREMQGMGYVWGTHYLPHDAGHVRQGQIDNLTPMEMLQGLGLKDIENEPRVEELQHGIQATRDMFSQAWFDEENTKEGFNHLQQYRKRWNATVGAWSSQPLKDIHTEAADAFRQWAQGYQAPRKTRGRRKRRGSSLAT